jgi:hypothetical protein
MKVIARVAQSMASRSDCQVASADSTRFTGRPVMSLQCGRMLSTKATMALFSQRSLLG